jgi:hypothetical protein
MTVLSPRSLDSLTPLAVMADQAYSAFEKYQQLNSETGEEGAAGEEMVVVEEKAAWPVTTLMNIMKTGMEEKAKGTPVGAIVKFLNLKQELEDAKSN